MKRNILLAALIMVMPFNLMAQDDDMYFVPKKKVKTENTGRAQATTYTLDANDPDLQDVDPDYHTGALRNADEYNRRGHKNRNFGEIYMQNDTLFISEDSLMAEDSLQMRMKELEEADDYDYSSRLVRFHGGVRSPYYWDYYYDWCYDPFFYDPWYYGPGYYGWYGPYYSSYYRHGWYGWYDPWYDYAFGWGGYYGGYYHGYYNGWYGHVSHPGHSGILTGYRGHRSEASRLGGRRTNTGISAARGQGVSAARGTRGVNSTSSRSVNAVREGSVNSMRTNGITGNMRRDGLNTNSRATRGYDTDARTATRTQSTQTTVRNQQNTRNNGYQGVSSQRATRTETPTRVQTPTRTETPARVETPVRSTPTYGGGNSGGGSFGGARGGGGGIGGGSVGGGSSRGRR